MELVNGQQNPLVIRLSFGAQVRGVDTFETIKASWGVFAQSVTFASLITTQRHKLGNHIQYNLLNIMGFVSKETIVLGKLGGNDLVTESMIKLLCFLEPGFGIWRVCLLSFVSIEIVLQNPNQITRKYLFQVKPNFVWTQ